MIDFLIKQSLYFNQCIQNNFNLKFCPRIGSKSQKICSAKSVTCCEDAKTDMMLKEFNQENNIKDESSTYNELNHCNCLPSCTLIAYDSEISQAAYDWKSTLSSLINSSSFDFSGLVVILGQYITCVLSIK